MREWVWTLLLLPFTASAQEVVPIAASHPLSITWTDAAGPVESYRSKLVYLDGTESFVVVGHPPQEFTPRREAPFRVFVQGCDSDAECGPWSVPSDLIVSCPIRSDLDCNMAVGISDAAILFKDWGKRYGER